MNAFDLAVVGGRLVASTRGILRAARRRGAPGVAHARRSCSGSGSRTRSACSALGSASWWAWWRLSRGLLRTRGPWLAAALALLLFVPHLLWQARTAGRHSSSCANARAQDARAGAASTGCSSSQLMNPLAAPVWLAGLVVSARRAAGRGRRRGHRLPDRRSWCCRRPGQRLLRRAGVPAALRRGRRSLRAAGAVDARPRPRAGSRRWSWCGRRPGRAAAGATQGLSGRALRVPGRARALARRGGERHEVGQLPPFFADRYGWAELVATVARYTGRCPGRARAACVFAENYGQAER